MKMRIRNPNRAPAEVVTAADKADLEAALAKLSDRDPTFAEVRAALAAGKRDRFSDGHMHQTALALGLTVRHD